MKIQITGVTSNQLNIYRKRNPLYSAARGLYDFFNLRKDDCIINTSEITDADVLLYGLYSLNSFVSGGFLKTAQVISDALNTNKKIAYFVDDWHIDSIGKNLTACNNDIDGYLRFGKKLLGREPTDLEVKQYATALQHMMTSDAPILVHVLPWLVDDEECLDNYANSLMVSRDRIVLYDPTMFINWDIPEVEQDTNINEEKAWVVASRYDFRRFVEKNMQPSWPVVYYGCKKIETSNFVPNEIDLVNAAYRQNWGLVSHPYPKHLQGQWRNKFIFASVSTSVIYAEGKEAQGMETFLPVSEIEKMNGVELSDLHYNQTNEMADHYDYDYSAERVLGALE